MADPATQFQQAGLNIPYQFSPTVTRLNPPIQLPETGQLWAEVGKTALQAVGQAGEMLQKSPLNPAVREKMKFSVANYQQGEKAIAAAEKLPYGLGSWLRGVDANGNPYMIPPAQGSTTYQSWIAPNMDDGDSKDGKPPAVLDESGKAPSPGEPVPKAAPPAPPPVNAAPPPPPPVNTTQVSTPSPSMFAGRPAQPPAAPQGPSPDQIAAGLQEAQQRNLFASSGQGVPTGYQPPSQGGPGGTPAAATQADQAAMAQWQEQNAHPVMSSQDALGWMKSQTTLAQDATYLPNGGPGGSPAYAFHMKGGGINTVPVSQMIQRGAGPVVAAQNTSAVLSKSDQIRQSQQAPPGPPAAPQVAQGGQVWNPQQPAPGPTAPPAAPSTAYNPAPYQQAVAQATANPQNLTAQAVGGQPAQPAPPVVPVLPADAPAAIADLERAPDGTVDSETGDTRKQKIGNLWYYRDNSDTPWKGRYYTALPGTSTWTQRRFYLGDDHYQELQLPDTVLNENLQKEVQSGTGPPGLKTLSNAQILAMPREQKQAYLDYAKSFHNTGGVSNSETNNFLQASLDAIKQIEQAKDIVHATPNPADYSDQAKDAYKSFKQNHSLLNDPDPGLKGWVHHVQGRILSAWSGGDFPASDDMSRVLGNLATDLKTPGLEPVNGMVAPATGGWHLNAQLPLGRMWMPINVGNEGTPAHQDPMEIPAITNLTKGGTSKEDKIGRLQQLQDTIVTNLHNRYHLALTDNERVDPGAASDILNVVKAGAGKDKPISIPDNIYRDTDGKRRNPYKMPQIFGPEDLDAFKKSHPSGTHYMGPNADGNMTEYVTQ